MREQILQQFFYALIHATVLDYEWDGIYIQTKKHTQGKETFIHTQLY